MDWFEMLDKAKANGLAYAVSGIEGGETMPQESPLSGEWAGAPTPKDIVADLGGDIEKLEHFEVEDICSHWEDGYNSAPWPGEFPDGTRVVWTDPDGGAERTGTIKGIIDGDDAYLLDFGDGSETQAYSHELRRSE